MNFSAFGYVFSTETPGGWISVGILAFCLLSLVIGLIYGLKRGLGKTVIRIVTIAVAAVAAYYLTVGISSYLTELFLGKTLEEVVRTFVADYDTAVSDEIKQVIAALDAETAHYAVSLVVSILLTPIVFIIAFYLAKLITLIVYWILSAIIGIFERDKGLFSTLGGAVMGLVQGAVIAIVVMLPVSGVLTLAGEVRDEVMANDEIPDSTQLEVSNFYGWWLDDAIENPVTELVYTYGGESVYEGLTYTVVDGIEYDMREQAKAIAHAIVDASELQQMDWRTPNADEKAAMRRIEADVGENPYLASMFAGILRGAATLIEDNPGIIPLEEPYLSLCVQLISTFNGSNAVTVNEDLTTLLEVYFIMGDEGMLYELGEGDYESLKNVLVSKNEDGVLVIDRLIAELNKNERLSHIIELLATLSVSIMADSMDLGEDATVLYENVKGGLMEAITISASDYETDEEYRAAVNESVSNTLESNGITLDAEIVESMSNFVADNYSDVTEITDAELNATIFSYYASYVSMVESGEIKDGELNDDIIQDIINGGSGDDDEITDEEREELEDIIGGSDGDDELTEEERKELEDIIGGSDGDDELTDEEREALEDLLGGSGNN